MIYADRPQSDNGSKQSQYVDVFKAERISEQTTNVMHERIIFIQIVELVVNAEPNEPLAEVCVVNVDNFINAHEQTQKSKADSTLWTERETAAIIALHRMLPNRNNVNQS